MASTEVLKNKSLKPLDLYQQEEEDEELVVEDQQVNENPNYDFDVEDFWEDDEENKEEDFLDEEIKNRMESELLFLTQGVG